MGTNDIVATAATFIQYPIGIDEVVVRYVTIGAGIDVKIPDAQDNLCPVVGGIHPCGMVYNQVRNGSITRRRARPRSTPGIAPHHLGSRAGFSRQRADVRLPAALASRPDGARTRSARTQPPM